MLFFFSSRRRHTRYWRDWSSDVCSSDLLRRQVVGQALAAGFGRRMEQRHGMQQVDAGLAVVQRPQRRQRGDRKSVVQGKSVELGGRRILKKKKRKLEFIYSRHTALLRHS